ncbi:MAG: RelA/SpoT family protein [Bacteroidales bacterium]|jgi:GTP pyrophosphokinase|nr:RelA/SpoT family protein [Bacteroidales bacterium]
MIPYIPNAELERKTILQKYKELLSYMYDKTSVEQRRLIRKSFAFACTAHKDMRRRTGEPYIYHPLAVAKIVSQEINLGTTSVACAFLHDVVEDTSYTITDIQDIFGETIAKIVNGLTKIENIILDTSISVQAENFRKIFLTMSDDIRVILIKLADRLHNMRTLSAMSPEKQLKISSETSFFYVPIAHRLGLYSIKSELEDYAMLYTDPDSYHLIENRLSSTETERQKLITDFVKPISEKLKKTGIKAEMSSRTKSIYSIYQKMKRKQINFEDVYDIFAVRYVFDSAPEDEMRICWAIYTIVTSLYQTNTKRERNFLVHPKANGYQSLHVTAMSNSGKWVEVQIRSKRMDEIAEKGFAAHFKYKEENRQPTEYENRVEDWLSKIREVLKSDNSNALDFLNEIKLNLELKEVFVFTPKGDMKTLPAGSTVLDFAYDLHTKIGSQCIGAKVNYNIVPNNYILKNGDQVEVIISKKQTPKLEWFNCVKTSKARESIKESIRIEYKKSVDKGEQQLKQIFDELEIEYSGQNINKLRASLKIRSEVEFWNYVAQNKLTSDKAKKILSNEKNIELEEFQKRVSEEISNRSLDDLIYEQLKTNPDIFTLDDTVDIIKYTLSPCCNPLPGDQVVGFQVSHDEIVVHQTSCPKAIEQMSKFGNRIIKAKWNKEQDIAFLSGLRISGFNKKGMIRDIINVISDQFDLNIRSLQIESKGSVFAGTIMLYIQNVKALDKLIETLKKIDNIESINRVGYELD